MYLILLLIALWLLFNVLWHRRAKQKAAEDEIHFEAFFPILISAIVFLFGGMFLNLALFILLPTKTVTTDTELVAMRSSDSVSGNFVIGSGSVNGVMLYHVYVKNSDGSVSPQQISSETDVRIYQEASRKDQGVWSQSCRVKDSSTALGSWVISLELSKLHCSNSFFVPVGTVVQNFKVN